MFERMTDNRDEPIPAQTIATSGPIDADHIGTGDDQYFDSSRQLRTAACVRSRTLTGEYQPVAVVNTRRPTSPTTRIASIRPHRRSILRQHTYESVGVGVPIRSRGRKTRAVSARSARRRTPGVTFVGRSRLRYTHGPDRRQRWRISDVDEKRQLEYPGRDRGLSWAVRGGVRPATIDVAFASARWPSKLYASAPDLLTFPRPRELPSGARVGHVRQPRPGRGFPRPGGHPGGRRFLLRLCDADAA